ncbi:MAG: MerR family transcriptional regulator [Syntrophales bacterium]|nr:MerR family transcriptional regulator [Syntrophales bacterium]
MKVKIGEISKKSGVPASTIRYYVREGLLPLPDKVNKKMAYYDEACIERLKAIQDLQGKRYYPLFLIKNILRRMDDGLSLQEAESVENAVFGAEGDAQKGLMDRNAAVKEMGLTDEELELAEAIGILIPFVHQDGKTLYDDDDIRIGRDSLRKLLDYGLNLQDLAFLVDLGRQIIDKEMLLRRKIVSDKGIKENIRITTEISLSSGFFREYILRRLFQSRVQENIRKSLDKKKRLSEETP